MADSAGQRLMSWVRAVDRWTVQPKPWYIWPSALVFMGAVSTGLALLFQPHDAHWVYIFGQQFGDTCGMIQATGLPCPQCGMTRSWVLGARGRIVEAFWFNPAGLILLWWLQAGGLIGLIRLVLRKPTFARVPPNLMAAWATFWMLGLYFLPWLGRVALGINPLP